MKNYYDLDLDFSRYELFILIYQQCPTEKEAKVHRIKFPDKFLTMNSFIAFKIRRV